MLTILIVLPAAAALLGTFVIVPRLSGFVALAGAVGALALSIVLIAKYHAGHHGLIYLEDHVWIRALGIHYKVGVDGLNVFLVAMTTFTFAIALLAANLREWDRPKLFYLLMGIAESAVLGAFLAQDLALFVAFFDLMLIPFYFLAGAWGQGPDRIRATLKLVIYTFVGSLLMLAAAVATGVLAAHQHGGVHITFVLSQLQTMHLSRGSQEWIFLLFAAAFLVKMPAFPLHGWMPDGYKAMPLEVLMVFSSVLSKVAAYGFLRIALPLFPQAAVHFQMLMLLIALISILYGSACAFTQSDIRLVVGYSSVAQLGFITLGIFSLKSTGAQGALLQMVNHALVTAPLMFIILLVGARAGGSEDMRDLGGIAKSAPVLAGLFLVVSLATLAMPGSGNFVGEFLILLGVFRAKLAIAIIAFTGVVMASIYMLRAFIRAMHNRVGPKVTGGDLSLREAFVLVPMVLAILFFALYPQLALHRSKNSVNTSIGQETALTAPPTQTASAGSGP
ncbi:MAG TPA: NADH-quinone oxidoreductase subunit M [Solirubrobacteraceae bacterium]|jgi:NADH-quinone oxidoreductase subunit M|nr:NADH-quinone oxidoreductase subunit M [Solirubrobacteraceae bacterium]